MQAFYISHFFARDWTKRSLAGERRKAGRLLG
jgi:hypothetical protein